MIGFSIATYYLFPKLLQHGITELEAIINHSLPLVVDYPSKFYRICDLILSKKIAIAGGTASFNKP